MRVTTMPPIGCMKKKVSGTWQTLEDYVLLLISIPQLLLFLQNPSRTFSMGFKRGCLQPSHRAGILVYQNESWRLGPLVHDWLGMDAFQVHEARVGTNLLLRRTKKRVSWKPLCVPLPGFSPGVVAAILPWFR